MSHTPEKRAAYYAPGLVEVSAYRLEKAEPDASWDAFVESSPQGTVFSCSSFITGVTDTPGLWYCMKGQERHAAIALLEDGVGQTCFNDFVIYNGIMLAPRDTTQSVSRNLAESFRVTCACLTGLHERYDSLAFTLHPSFPDIRPFLWQNYGTDGPHYDSNVRYTSHLDLGDSNTSGVLEDTQIFSIAHKSRRQAYKNAQKSGVVTELFFDISLFLDFYVLTFERQGLPPELDLGILQRILSGLHEDNRLRMYVSRDREGAPASVAIFATDSKRAYYLYGANDPALRKTHAGTAVLWDAFCDLNRSGITEVDFEGINSPHRGYFKLSFGGTADAYYQLGYNMTDNASQ